MQRKAAVGDFFCDAIIFFWFIRILVEAEG
jgi:hypothetical protein